MTITVLITYILHPRNDLLFSGYEQHKIYWIYSTLFHLVLYWHHGHIVAGALVDTSADLPRYFRRCFVWRFLFVAWVRRFTRGMLWQI